jgi:predicted NBD/HSP70 family sugar kinase
VKHQSALNSKLSGIHNRGIVCELILANPGISRSEIADRIGLTRAALSHILAGLLDEGIATESKRFEESRRAGPKSLSLQINPDYGLILAVNIGHFTATASLYRADGTSILRKSTPHYGAFPFDVFIKVIVADLLERTLQEAHSDRSRLLGIGIAAPGYFSPVQTVESPCGESIPRHPLYNWHDLGLTEEMENRFGVPTIAGNCTDFAAVAENFFGHGRYSQRFVLYSIGIGVGSAVVDGGRLYSGSCGISGEIGHTSVNIEGRQCYCGNTGCLETYASMGNLLEISQDGFFSWDPELDYKATVQAIQSVLTAARAGEASALQAVRDVSRYVAAGAVTLINLFAPDKLILAPNELGPTDIGIFVEYVQEHVRSAAFSSLRENVVVEQTAMPEELELRGAFVHVLEHVVRQLEKKT